MDRGEATGGKIGPTNLLMDYAKERGQKAEGKQVRRSKDSDYEMLHCPRNQKLGSVARNRAL